jgi:excisionase family DNA binding protein
MTSQEVAQQLRVHPATLRRWVAQGKLQAVDLPGSRSRRYRRDDIEALLQGQAAS